MTRRIAFPALLAFALLLCGFVPTTERVLARCREVTPVITKQHRITLNSRPGKLLVGAPGKHSLVFDDGETVLDPGLESLSPEFASARRGPNTLTSLFRLLDFYSPARPQDFLDLLSYCLIDLNRRGWVRLDEGGDRLAVTIGAMGESEADFPQLWVDRSTYRIVRLALPDDSAALVGPVGAENLPQWILLDGGSVRLQFVLPESPAKKK